MLLLPFNDVSVNLCDISFYISLYSNFIILITIAVKSKLMDIRKKMLALRIVVYMWSDVIMSSSVQAELMTHVHQNISKQHCFLDSLKY
jgi:hypothetical protein